MKKNFSMSKQKKEGEKIRISDIYFIRCNLQLIELLFGDTEMSIR